MTVVAPVEWKRQSMDSNDQYGRVLETYRSCKASNDKTKWFLGSLFALNFLAVLLSNFQIFLARNLPRKLNESKDVAFSMIMLLEACLVGVPVLVVVKDSPTARFLVPTSLVVVVCLAVVAPQVPSKVQQQRHVSVRGSTDATSGSVLQKLGISRSGMSSFDGGATSIGRASAVRAHVILPPPGAPDNLPQSLEASVSSFGGG